MIKTRDNKEARTKKTCAVDFCNQDAQNTNKHGMCYRHGDMLEFLLWAMPRVKVEKKGGSELVLPKDAKMNLVVPK